MIQPRDEIPYQKCPVYETEHFLFRLVQLEDAQDLLDCYSDPMSALIFNSDNCSNDFVYQTVEEVRNMIGFWLDEYALGYYVRFSIIEKSSSRAVGSVECFAKQEIFPDYGRGGLLRIDLASRHETETDLAEILCMVNNHFYDCFKVDSIITKAIPAAIHRTAALHDNGYTALKNQTIVPYDDYFVSIRNHCA
jgi:[ribosomal protein S5]-alanine N-acetyltransferase